MFFFCVIMNEPIKWHMFLYAERSSTMDSYVPDGYIVCECCHTYFVSYTAMYPIVDADAKNSVTQSALDGNINRIFCPNCESTFTYESMFYIFSGNHKFAIVSHAGNTIPGVASFETACKISSATDWKFRVCSYTADCLEKMRIFRAKLDDTKIEKLKLMFFDSYKTMDLRDEYITFLSRDEDFLYFEHRTFTDKMIEEFKIPYHQYQTISAESVKPGTWVSINREWAIKSMEVQK